MRIYKLAALAVTPLFLLGCPAPEDRDPLVDDDRAAEERVHQIGDTETLNLGEVDDSGVGGDVRFTVLTQNETDVVIEVQDAQPNASYQAAVHQGTCDNVGPQRHALETIQTNEQGDGAASTTLNVQLATVMDGNHVVALHGPRADRADTDMDVTDDEDEAVARTDRPVACGEIGEAGRLGW
jgi:hypothetical protein